MLKLNHKREIVEREKKKPATETEPVSLSASSQKQTNEDERLRYFWAELERNAATAALIHGGEKKEKNRPAA